MEKSWDTPRADVGYLPQATICDKIVTTEVASDFSLPDYQPEIRRLLSTRVCPLPPASYVGSDEIEAAGDIAYTILYIGGDGALYSAVLSDKYRCSAPLSYAEGQMPGDGEGVIDTLPESVTARVLAPRKLNIRTKLRSHIRAFAPARCDVTINGAAKEETLQYRYGRVPVRRLFALSSDPVAVDDLLPLENLPDTLRVVDSSASALMTEIQPAAGTLSCRGEVTVKILLCNEAESDLPTSVVRKIPFTCRLEDERITSADETRVSGHVTRLAVTPEEGGFRCDAELTVCAQIQSNTPFTYVEDMYSTERGGEYAYESLVLPRAIRAGSGNLTQNERVERSRLSLSEQAKILDIDGSAAVLSCELTDGKLVFKGESVYRLLCAEDDGITEKEITLPFRYDTDAHTSENAPVAWDAEALPISMRARIDGDTLSMDAEILLSYRASRDVTIERLREITFAEEAIPRESAYTVYYPNADDTLWSVAKTYALPPEEIAVRNGLSNGDGPLGKKFLIL